MHIRPPHLIQSNIDLIFHNYECLHKRAKNHNITNDICNTNIESVEMYKYLGVYVDNKFKWKTHIINLQKKLRKSANMLHYLSYCSTYNVLRQLRTHWLNLIYDMVSLLGKVQHIVEYYKIHKSNYYKFWKKTIIS